MSFVLVAGAGLMIQSLANLRAIDVGFQPEGLLTMRVPLPMPKYSDIVTRNAFYNTVLAELERVPSVTGAGFTSTLPFTSRGNTGGYRIEGRTLEPSDPAEALLRIVTPGYLSALGVSVLAGRLPNQNDGPNSPPIAVVNNTFARRYWPDESPLEHRIAVNAPDAPWMTIVGVVADVYETGYEIRMRPEMYVLASQAPRPADALIIRTSTDPLSVVPDVRRIVLGADADQPIAAVRTMNQIVDLEVVNRRRQTILFDTFAVIALLQAAMGLFGLLSYSVAQQQREIGLRIALGATIGGVRRMVLGQGLTIAVVGLVIGFAVALASARAIQPLLYGLQPHDLPTLVAVSVTLMIVCAIACWMPTLRAARTDPKIILREE
jgi:predicted permease